MVRFHFLVENHFFLCHGQNNVDYNSFQISTSSNIWPSEYYWGKLAEKYGIKFNGSSLTYRQARDMMSLGAKPFIYDKIKEHISSNYLKVSSLFEEVTFYPWFYIYIPKSCF